MPQPWHKSVELLFTTTRDVTEEMTTPEFRQKLEGFLKRNLGAMVKGSVEVNTSEAEPGDPRDLD